MLKALTYAFNPIIVLRELFNVGRWGMYYIPLCSILMIWLSVQWGSSWWEILSAVSGVICVVLVAERKLTNFFWGLINCVLYGLTSYYNKFYGDMSLNWLLYVPFQFIGLFAWYQNTSDLVEVKAKRLKLSHLVILTVAVYGAWAMGSFILMLAKGAHPLADSANVVLSVVATILMWKRYREQWICWILVNISGIVMWSLNAFYLSKSGDPALLMWIAFLINSIYGYWTWTKASKNEIS